jgi:cobalt-zinc-cadmium efflux system protein
LLEGVPEEVDIEALRRDLLALDGVEGIHQLKVWAISSKNIHLAVHLYAPLVNQQMLYQQAMHLLHEQYGITQTTLQIEQTNCHELLHDHATHNHAEHTH